jgi:hypothetical protein
MRIFRIKDFEGYKKHVAANWKNSASMKEYETKITPAKSKRFSIRGISYPANQYVNFAVDYLYSNGTDINWRERLVCPISGLNNRLRCCAHIIDIELSPYPDSSFYITEQVTALYAYLKSKYSNLQGSEYLQNENVKPGSIVNNIRHEDMTNLSFDNGLFDYYLSFECLEHIPMYKNAIPEVYRVLKRNGLFMGTFPFDPNKYDNFIRATLDDEGNIVHLAEPEYHGDPVGGGHGILCYTVFGWEVLDEFRKAGFTDVYAVLVWSDVFGYLGGEQLFFVAKK